MAACVCRVNRSANEVMVLAAKAARGAGAPPAQAAQFGAAAVVHICAGRGFDALNAALEHLPDGPILDLPLALARIAEGAQDGHATASLGIDIADLTHSYVAASPYQADLTQDGILTLDLNTPASRAPVQRIDLPAEIYEAWSVLAARLLVPESAASRLSGAGAGLSDND